LKAFDSFRINPGWIIAATESESRIEHLKKHRVLIVWASCPALCVYLVAVQAYFIHLSVAEKELSVLLDPDRFDFDFVWCVGC
jgi:hypothetical protein